MGIFHSTSIRILALGALAGGAALLSNALAPPSRRLAWGGRPGTAASPLPSTPAPPRPLPAPPPEDAPPMPEEPSPSRPIPPPAPKQPAAAPLQPPPVLPAAPPSSPIREITTQEAWDAFQAGASFLDARRSAEFAEGHVSGAFCAPVWEADLEDRLFTFKATRRPGPEDPIVIYCSGGDCRDSHLLAEKLLSEGYGHLLIFRDGYPAWVAKGHPTAKGQP